MNLKLKLFICVVLVLFLFSSTSTQQSFPLFPELPTDIVSMTLDDYREYLKSHPPLDRLHGSAEKCYFLVNKEDIKRIKKSGITIIDQKSLPNVLPSPADLSRQFEGEAPEGVAPPTYYCSRNTQIPEKESWNENKVLQYSNTDVNGRYHNYRETEAFLLDLGNLYPGMAEVFSIGQSIEGREIYMIKISDNVHLEEEEPNVYFVGCHHGNEWISVEVPLLFARYLLEHYPDNPEVQQVINGSQMYILPLLNPDGLEFAVHVYRWWRKNRRYNGGYSFGVDLNRNYGYLWGYDDEGSSPDPRSGSYRGAYPFSEPETNAFQQFALAHPPAGALTYHSYHHLIMYPWGYTPEPAPDMAEMHEIAKEMSERIFQVNGRTYLYGQGPEILYLTNGDFDDWVYGTFGAPSYTVELSAPDYFSGAFFTPEEEIDLCFSENLPAMLYFANYFITKSGWHPHPIHGQSDAVLSGRHLKSLFFLQAFTGF
jgi:murein tripeptide amidase MpaA